MTALRECRKICKILQVALRLHSLEKNESKGIKQNPKKLEERKGRLMKC